MGIRRGTIPTMNCTVWYRQQHPVYNSVPPLFAVSALRGNARAATAMSAASCVHACERAPARVSATCDRDFRRGSRRVFKEPLTRVVNRGLFPRPWNILLHGGSYRGPVWCTCSRMPGGCECSRSSSSRASLATRGCPLPPTRWGH